MEAIFAAFGKAILYSHHLEREVGLFVASWSALKDRSSDQTFASHVNELHGKTFGQVIQIGVANGAISGEMLETLTFAKELRNLLVHRTSEWLPLKIATKFGLSDAFDELWGTGELFKGLATEIHQYTMLCSELRGISRERIYKHARKVWRRASVLDRLGLAKSPS